MIVNSFANKNVLSFNKTVRNKYPSIKFQSASSVKTTLVTGFLALSSLGVITSCNNETKKTDSNTNEYSCVQADLSHRGEYIDTLTSEYIIKRGETLYKIAGDNGMNVHDLSRANNIDEKSIIKPGEILKINNEYKINNIKNLDDVSKATGLTTDYLKKLEKTENPNNIKSVFYDVNGNATIGVGHKIIGNEFEKYKNKEISSKEKYTLLASDFIKKEKSIKRIIPAKDFDALPVQLRDNVLDFVFSRGEGSFKENTGLVNGLKNKDYTKAVANLAMNYSIVKDKNGNEYKKYLAGLCKRSLIRMSDASKIFGDNIPDEVIVSANETYKLGLLLLQKDKENGKYDDSTYKNVKKDYEKVCLGLFGGKLSQNQSEILPSNDKIESHSINNNAKIILANNKQFSPEELYNCAIAGAKNANEYKNVKNPYIYRPYPNVNSSNHIEASCEIKYPTDKNGTLKNKVIIVNAGHGGYCPKNGFFDPGTVLTVKNKSGNLMPIEEWRVTKDYSESLTEKLTSKGATVVLVSGAVKNGGMASTHYLEKLLEGNAGSHDIRKIMKNTNKKNVAFISIHVESDKEHPDKKCSTVRIQNGDKKDLEFAKSIEKNIKKTLINLSPTAAWDNLYVTRAMGMEVPAVLVELGNIANDKVCNSLLSQYDKDKYTTGLANSVEDIFNQK